jgi:hypothetical protein
VFLVEDRDEDRRDHNGNITGDDDPNNDGPNDRPGREPRGVRIVVKAGLSRGKTMRVRTERGLAARGNGKVCGVGVREET